MQEKLKPVEYELVRSNRKTVAICVKPDGRVVVRAPRRASAGEIAEIVAARGSWIRNSLEKLARQREQRMVIRLDPAEAAEAKRRMKDILYERCAYFAERMGVEYRSIKVNSAAARWGSCTSEGNLNFTYRLFFADPALIDYVVVHELAHRKEMNHSSRFWHVVASVMPDYSERRAALREFQKYVEIVETKRGNRIEKQ